MYFSHMEVTPSDFRAALSPLESHGFPFNDWTIESVYEFGSTPKRFLKSIKILTSTTDDNFRAVMIKSMIIGGYFDSATNATPFSLFKGCDWLKTEAGKSVVRFEQLKTKLAKRAFGTTRSVKQMSLLTMFDRQRNDLAVEKRKLSESNKRNQIEINELNINFPPASDYVEMTHSEVKVSCVELLKQNSASSLSEVNEIVALNLYEKFVKERHVLNFLEDQVTQVTRESQLREYLESRIKYYDSIYDYKNRDKFMDHLKICFGEDVEVHGCKRLRDDSSDDSVSSDEGECYEDSNKCSRAAQRPRIDKSLAK